MFLTLLVVVRVVVDTGTVALSITWHHCQKILSSKWCREMFLGVVQLSIWCESIFTKIRS